MIIGNNNLKNTSFGQIFAISANDSQFKELHSIVRNASGKYGLYGVNNRKLKTADTFIQQAKANGQDVYILVAGKKDLNNVILGKKGWNSISGICRKINKYIALKDVRQDVKPILVAMKEDDESEIKVAKVQA
jgi:hypothetical protein